MTNSGSPLRPRVSVVLATHNRPHFLPVALTCYAHQTYTQRELIVVDDSDPPVDVEPVESVGGRLFRMPENTPLGDKLNHGLSQASGPLALKMDDDDWYAPEFLEHMVSRLVSTWNGVTRRIMAALMPFLLFDLARWEVRVGSPDQFSGATLLFTLADWSRHPFQSRASQVDSEFARDQTVSGTRLIGVQALETFLQLRHGRHLWTEQHDGTSVEAYMAGLPLYQGGPEALLPAWALDAYRDIRRGHGPL